ncbi:hypothetical protein psyc5s11_36740 [Clostridium gelidum]|uniref:MrpR N-terminal core-binding domain-containing protein n=1 Tax=Clostridium gelidum TaxID=704125 RepID=A0ABN6J052_9CLOT|nr:hypothetical protein [Clostridium gelidum]BCZ47607.1 hypothetical protein psyc5s11_36740 [Clostridium gelidum]
MYEFLGRGLTYDELNEFQKRKADWIEKIDRYSENTRKVYWVVLNSKVTPLEIQENKDLYNWNKEEIISLIKDNTTNSKATKMNLYTIIVMYIKWAYQNGVKSGENPCDTIDTKALFTIDEAVLKESYQTLQEFYDFILGLNCSDVDRAMITLIRYGVSIDQVGTIKWEDIDKENKVLNVNREEKESLQLPIDNLFIMMIDKAKMCDRYAPGQKMVEYVDYGYVIKASATVDWKVIPAINIYNKVGVISRNNKIMRISVSKLYINRKHDLLFNILNDYGKVTKLDIEKVIEIFGEEITAIKSFKLKQEFELISSRVVEWKRKNRTK